MNLKRVKISTVLLCLLFAGCAPLAVKVIEKKGTVDLKVPAGERILIIVDPVKHPRSLTPKGFFAKTCPIGDTLYMRAVKHGFSRSDFGKGNEAWVEYVSGSSDLKQLLEQHSERKTVLFLERSNMDFTGHYEYSAKVGKVRTGNNLESDFFITVFREREKVLSLSIHASGLFTTNDIGERISLNFKQALNVLYSYK